MKALRWAEMTYPYLIGRVTKSLVSLEENVGYITAIGAVTMESGSIIGNSLKTIFSRITTMQSSKDVLESVGVAISNIGKNGEETVRPVSDILDDLGVRWDRLSDSERQNIAVKVAG
jgi:TP901 family phage tail tape measure protein